MGTGAITSYVDVAQLVLYAFWLSFAALIYYLQRESKREGFPLESQRPNGQVYTTTGLVSMPNPKVYKTADGHEYFAPSDKKSPQVLKAVPRNRFNGAPLEPTGNPMLDGVGPGAYADRADRPELTFEGHPLIAPLRAAAGFSVSTKDINPIGLPVLGADGQVAGKVVDMWLDKAEMIFRHIEVEVPTSSGGRRVLLPINFSRIGRFNVQVKSILSTQFALVPGLKNPDQITMLEEEKIMAYYGGGTLYATPDRQECLF
jgi:photosynthetic reaction center H subunit